MIGLIIDLILIMMNCFIIILINLNIIGSIHHYDYFMITIMNGYFYFYYYYFYYLYYYCYYF